MHAYSCQSLDCFDPNSNQAIRAGKWKRRQTRELAYLKARFQEGKEVRVGFDHEFGKEEEEASYLLRSLHVCLPSV